MKRMRIKYILCTTIVAASVLTGGTFVSADGTEVSEDEPFEIEEVEVPDTEVTEPSEEEILPEEEDDIIPEVEEPEPEDTDIIIEVEDETSVEVSDGWIKDGDKWYYYQDGEPVTGLKTIKGKTYYFDTDGQMKTGQVYLYNSEVQHFVSYFFDENGVMQTGFVTYDGALYYHDENGRGVDAGWYEIDGKRYYCNDYGYVRRGTMFNVDGDAYATDDDGVMRTGWYRQDIYSLYYYDEEGKGCCAEGWKKIDGKWYYFEKKSTYDSVPSTVVTGYLTDNGNTYYFDENGVMQTGWKLLNVSGSQRWTYFKSSGAMIGEGWQKINNKWYYFNELSGVNRLITDGVYKIDDEYYCFDKNGVMKTGWVLIDNGTSQRWFYCKSNGAAVSGFYEIGGKTYLFGGYSYGAPAMVTGHYSKNNEHYFFKPSGEMFTGWKRDEDRPDEWNYFGADGIAASGWTKIDGKWYLFNIHSSTADVPHMVTGFYTDFFTDEQYYLDENGIMQTGWVEVQGHWIYADKKGLILEDQWLKSGNNWYYLGAWGVPVTGYYTIGNIAYKFDADGVCLNPDQEPLDIDPAANGWARQDGIWLYYVNGEPVKGWKKIGKNWYYFGEAGEMYIGACLIDGECYGFDENGHMLTGWQYINGYWYYFGKSGKGYRGFNTLGGKIYYFNEDKGALSYMYIGLQEIGEDYYLFDANGVKQTGGLVYADRSDGWVYLDENGAAQRGWITIDGKLHYFREIGWPLMYENGLKNISSEGAWYYFNSDGSMHTGWKFVDGYNAGWTYFGSNGKMISEGFHKIKGKMYYFAPSYSGSTQMYMVTGVKKIGDDYYCFDDNGVMQTGWVKITKDNTEYMAYFDEDGKSVSGWMEIDGKTYYFVTMSNLPSKMLQDTIVSFQDGEYTSQRTDDPRYFTSDGSMAVNGLYTYGQYTYYFDGEGKAVTGWQKVGDNWYFFNNLYHLYTSCFFSDDDHSYYCDENGIMIKGFFTVGRYTYYADGSGYILKKRWLQMPNGDWCYFDFNGRRVTGFYTINSKLYHFDGNGVCLNP